MLIDLTTRRFLRDIALCRLSALIGILRCFSIYHRLDQNLRFIDPLRNICHNNRFPVKSNHLDILVSCDYDTICFLYFLRSQNVFSTTGSIGFHFYAYAQLLCFLFQSFRCHISMGDPGRTCCNRNDPVPFISTISFCCVFLFLVMFRFFSEFCFFCFIDHLQKFICSLC